MASLNDCKFIGNLGADPIVTPVGDTLVAKFSIAVSESWKDKTGVKQEKVVWVNAEAWGGLAQVCGDYLTKGKQVFISGRFQTDQYEKDGVTKYSTKIVVKDMQMLGSKGDTPMASPVVRDKPEEEDIPF